MVNIAQKSVSSLVDSIAELERKVSYLEVPDFNVFWHQKVIGVKN